MVTNWSSYALGVASATAIYAVAVFILRNAILNTIRVMAEKEINNHKHDLDLHGERIKHDLQRDMLQAQITTDQKHKIYAKLYVLLMKADGAVGTLQGLRFEPTYEEYSPEEFDEMLKSREVKSEKRNEILSAFKERKARGVDLWQKYKRILELGSARMQITQAKNFWLLKELYISGEVSRQVHEITTKLFYRLIALENPIPSENSFEKAQKLEAEVVGLLGVVKKQMSGELGASV